MDTSFKDSDTHSETSNEEFNQGVDLYKQQFITFYFMCGRAIEKNTASNKGLGVHVRLSTTLCSFSYQDTYGKRRLMAEDEHYRNNR